MTENNYIYIGQISQYKCVRSLREWSARIPLCRRIPTAGSRATTEPLLVTSRNEVKLLVRDRDSIWSPQKCKTADSHPQPKLAPVVPSDCITEVRIP